MGDTGALGDASDTGTSGDAGGAGDASGGAGGAEGADGAGLVLAQVSLLYRYGTGLSLVWHRSCFGCGAQVSFRLVTRSCFRNNRSDPQLPEIHILRL